MRTASGNSHERFFVPAKRAYAAVFILPPIAPIEEVEKFQMEVLSDKQFTSLDNFPETGPQFFERERL